LARKLSPNGISEAQDRTYIQHYIESCKKYIRGDVLEFCGISYVPNATKCAMIGHENIYPEADFYFEMENAATLPDKKFDTIVATQVICYTTEWQKVLENFKSMLKPSGALIITNAGPIYPDCYDEKSYGYKSFYTKKGIKDMMEKTFGSANTFNLRSYGDIYSATKVLFEIRRENKDKITTDGYFSVTVGCVGIDNRKKEKEKK
jgi:SAM-dependent methyltransferase